MDLFRFDLGSFTLDGPELKEYLGTYPVGPVPVNVYLIGDLKLQARGSIAFDLTGLRENNLLRGLHLSNASVTLKASIGLRGAAGVTVLGYALEAGFQGKVTLSFTVSTGDVRLGTGESLSKKFDHLPEVDDFRGGVLPGGPVLLQQSDGLGLPGGGKDGADLHLLARFMHRWPRRSLPDPLFGQRTPGTAGGSQQAHRPLPPVAGSCCSAHYPVQQAAPDGRVETC